MPKAYMPRFHGPGAQGLRARRGISSSLVVGWMVGGYLADPLFSVAGEASPAALLPPFRSAVGPALPPGAGTTAVRNTAYSSGHATAGPLWTPAAWTAVGLLASVVAVVLLRRRSANSWVSRHA